MIYDYGYSNQEFQEIFMKVYNRLSGEKEEFIPVMNDYVGMYICGMTVQDRPHIGHIRSFMSADVIRRYLEFKGFQVRHVQNFTDIDDKIISRAQQEGVDYKVITARYIQEFFDLVDRLNLLRAHVYPRATEEIDSIINLIKHLLEKGHAYQSGDEVFFAVDTCSKYGELSGRKVDEMIAGTRFEVDAKKRNPLDFSLWKPAKPGEPYWETELGKGRPGWHIECSAMAIKYLGESFDFHGGGLDLIFPHHENEKAQSECATGEPFAKYWIESGLLTTEGEKMSKSLGNFAAVGDLINLYSANVLRFYLISKHYRSPIEFGDERLKEAKASFDRIENSLQMAYRFIKHTEEDLIYDSSVIQNHDIENEYLDKFIEIMDDDFNTAAALAFIFDLIKTLNVMIQSKEQNQKIKTLMISIMGLLKILGFQIHGNKERESHTLGNLMECVLSWRQALREQKNWALADKMRDDLKHIGIVIKDTSSGTEWDFE